MRNIRFTSGKASWHLVKCMHYNNAPITEAVIDIRVTPRAGTSALQIAERLSSIRDDFPLRQEIAAETSVEVSVGQSLQVDLGAGPILGGIRYIREDQQRILQARLGAFVYSYLPPYDRWETFRDEAHALWQMYCAAANPRNITRVALRYINRLDIPREGPVELSDYLKTYPQVSEDLPDHGPFSMQVQIHQPDISAIATIRVGLAISPDPVKFISIGLDIDVVRQRILWDVKEDKQLWEYLETLRVRKNEMFEACITEKTREVIQ